MNTQSFPLRCLVLALLGLLAACGDKADSGGAEPGTLELSRISFAAAEGTIVNVRVARSGGSDGVASVDYSTADGTALAGSDYIAANGTLTWPDGLSGNRTISITIIDDGIVEPSESFTVMLSNASVATLGANSLATVNIVADLSQLDGNSYTLEVDRIANNPDVQFPSEALQEADYEQTDQGNRYHVSFSEDAETVTVVGEPTAGEAAVMTGNMETDTGGLRRYEIERGLPAGGRFIVWIGDDHFEAELTVYGSGVPIVTSERGRLVVAN